MSTPSRRSTLTIIAAFLLGVSSASAALTPQQKCQRGKNQTAGKYFSCRQNAEAKLATTGDTVKYDAALEKCRVRFQTKWQKLEASVAKAGVACLDGVSSASVFDGVIGSCTDTVAAALRGDTSLPPSGKVLETHQTTCYDAVTNAATSCAGTGQDGELRKGLARSYTDNGDGTITDNQTGLTWEKLADDDGIHDKDATYTWAEAFAKVQQLNTTSCFAGRCDWRLPNVNELHSIVEYALSSPLIDGAFNTACAPSCTVTDCSCTGTGVGYWSSTTYTNPADTDPTQNAWEVLFDLGYIVIDAKVSSNFARAVRGGG